MTVLEQCQAWHEQDKHNAIVNTLEALPDSQRTAETDMELARAYNNLADPGKVNARDLLWRAIHRMEPHRSQLQDTYSWNFRMGYAYYYLDMGDAARPVSRTGFGPASRGRPQRQHRQRAAGDDRRLRHPASPAAGPRHRLHPDPGGHRLFCGPAMKEPTAISTRCCTICTS